MLQNFHSIIFFILTKRMQPWALFDKKTVTWLELYSAKLHTWQVSKIIIPLRANY